MKNPDRNQELDRKIAAVDRAIAVLSENEGACRLCPRECGVNRAAGEIGVCGIGAEALVARALLHFGEEPVLSGIRDCRKKTNRRSPARVGSGTVFFAGCALKCRFCQNYQISHLGKGRPVSVEQLAEMFLDLENRGALNLNLVTPSHVLPAILKALAFSFRRGLSLPVVYNCGGYEKPEVLRLLEGVVDIWLPDLKYHGREPAGELSNAPDYFVHASAAVLEMYCQQPRLEIRPDGAAKRGLIVRHLVLPGQGRDSISLLRWLARNLSPGIGLSLMSQFKPCFRTPPAYRRPLDPEEYRPVLENAVNLGFENLFTQPEPFSPGEHLLPDFDRDNPFEWKTTGKTRR